MGRNGELGDDGGGFGSERLRFSLGAAGDGGGGGGGGGRASQSHAAEPTAMRGGA